MDYSLHHLNPVTTYKKKLEIEIGAKSLQATGWELKMFYMGLTREEVCKNSTFSFFFCLIFFFKKNRNHFIIMLKRTPKQRVEINNSLSRTLLSNDTFSSFSSIRSGVDFGRLKNFSCFKETRKEINSTSYCLLKKKKKHSHSRSITRPNN